MTPNQNVFLPVDPEKLRQSMRCWPTGVSVVTSAFEGARHGMTVNAFSSISLDPPVVMVSLANITHTHALVQSSGVFGVTILAEDQGDVADRFAGRHLEVADRFEGIPTFSLVTGAPLLAGGLAHLDCAVREVVSIGPSSVYFGNVVAVSEPRAGLPLAYFNRIYQRLQK